MSIKIYFGAVLLSAAVGCPSSFADTVHLKRGGAIEGQVIERESTVEVRMSDGTTTFNREDIASIEKNEKGMGQGGALGAFDRLKNAAKRSANDVKRQFDRSLQGAKKQTSGWMQPIGKAKSTIAKEKALNDSMNELQKNLKELHSHEQTIAKEKRAMKKEGFDIH